MRVEQFNEFVTKQLAKVCNDTYLVNIAVFGSVGLSEFGKLMHEMVETIRDVPNLYILYPKTGVYGMRIPTFITSWLCSEKQITISGVVSSFREMPKNGVAVISCDSSYSGDAMINMLKNTGYVNSDVIFIVPFISVLAKTKLTQYTNGTAVFPSVDILVKEVKQVQVSNEQLSKNMTKFAKSVKTKKLNPKLVSVENAIVKRQIEITQTHEPKQAEIDLMNELTSPVFHITSNRVPKGIETAKRIFIAREVSDSVVETVLKKAINLSKLVISTTNVAVLKTISSAKLVDLTLIIDKLNVNDLTTTVQNITTLTLADMSFKDITNLQSLVGFKHLKRLDLWISGLPSLAFLIGTNLTTLNVYLSRLTMIGLRPVLDLKSLKSFTINRTAHLQTAENVKEFKTIISKLKKTATVNVYF